MNAGKEVIGWETNETFAVRYEWEVRKSDGKRYDDLTEAEQAELDADMSLSSYEQAMVQW